MDEWHASTDGADAVASAYSGDQMHVKGWYAPVPNGLPKIQTFVMGAQPRVGGTQSGLWRRWGRRNQARPVAVPRTRLGFRSRRAASQCLPLAVTTSRQLHLRTPNHRQAALNLPVASPCPRVNHPCLRPPPPRPTTFSTPARAAPRLLFPFSSTTHNSPPSRLPISSQTNSTIATNKTIPQPVNPQLPSRHLSLP